MSVEIYERENNTPKVLGELRSDIEKALEEIGIEAEGDCKQVTPVDTGRLRNSVTHIVNGGEKYVAVGTNVEYGRYVHEGTSRQHAQPFLTRPVQTNKDKYRKILERNLKT